MWKQGVPQEPGFYWLELEDMGGYPFITLGVFKLLWNDEEKESFLKDSLALARREMTKEEFNKKHLALYYCLPDMSESYIEWEVVMMLTHCAKHLKIEQPISPASV